MTALSFRDAMRLRAALDLTPLETAVIVALLDSEGPIARADLQQAAIDAGAKNKKVIDVRICTLNRKLPATVRVTSIYAEGARYSRGQFKPNPVTAHELSSAWAREHLLSLARGAKPLAEAA